MDERERHDILRQLGLGGFGSAWDAQAMQQCQAEFEHQYHAAMMNMPQLPNPFSGNYRLMYRGIPFEDAVEAVYAPPPKLTPASCRTMAIEDIRSGEKISQKSALTPCASERDGV